MKTQMNLSKLINIVIVFSLIAVFTLPIVPTASASSLWYYHTIETEKIQVGTDSTTGNPIFDFTAVAHFYVMDGGSTEGEFTGRCVPMGSDADYTLSGKMQVRDGSYFKCTYDDSIQDMLEAITGIEFVASDFSGSRINVTAEGFTTQMSFRDQIIGYSSENLALRVAPDATPELGLVAGEIDSWASLRSLSDNAHIQAHIANSSECANATGCMVKYYENGFVRGADMVSLSKFEVENWTSPLVAVFGHENNTVLMSANKIIFDPTCNMSGCS